MIAILNSKSISAEATSSNLNFMRQETIVLSSHHNVSDLITFQPGETRFFIEANVVKREFLLLSLGGFNVSGSIKTFLSIDNGKEFPINEYQWLIIKTDHLKGDEELNITIKFAGNS